MKQRVPNADDFPVLAGSTTPPARSPGGLVNGHTHSGPTAAQVLQAPAPIRKDSGKDSGASDGSPEPDLTKEHRPKEVNGVHSLNLSEPQLAHTPCIAAAGSAAPDVATQVSVTA